ncbi:sensor histidine kinase [Nonomuraea harbinensis]|uniref:histidine kinase n=1 Tax=Nonomuraea harbinensis TaxID=1286938 RepID=A0ABW1C7Q1_9ACTN|nr:HAMP domain-containing sensor histidine kinase [Nonomuraea harbinensis]
MIPDRGPGAGLLGPLGRRLLAAFALVALLSVAALTLASLMGTGAGLDTARRADREQAATRVAQSAATAYARAGTWAGADLAAARSLSAGAGARLSILDAKGRMVLSPGGSTPRHGMGSGAAAGQGITTAPIIVAGTTVGTAHLRFGTPAGSAARDVAWGWIAAAALLALALALGAGLLVTHRLSRPIRTVTRAARAFATGHRETRAGLRAPGELGELARAFDDMADEVTRSDRARRHLAADVAHELRTPLTALQAGLEELRDGLAEPDPARLAVLHDQALRLGRIVGDLAELSAAESAALSLRPRETDLAELTRRVLHAAEPRLHAAGLEVRADLAEAVVVHADPDRLHQAIGNLLDNAARYCAPHDTVTVTVRATGGQAIAEVADTGPGIPAKDLPHVFDRLWRGRSSGAVAGSGIGLAVVRELVTAHHGTVTARSQPGHGSAFTIHLPLRRSP